MQKLDLFKCDVCGNIVQTIIIGGGELVCCGQPMNRLEIKTKEDAMLEKHVPIFTKTEDGKDEIRVGEVLHPMKEEHHIVFIEAISEDKNNIQLKYLHSDEEPKMIFNKTSEK